MQMTDNPNMQLNKPKDSRNVLKTALKMNNKIHNIETTNERQTGRICNFENIMSESIKWSRMP